MSFIEGPKGRRYLDHSPKTVCLIGMGPSIQDYMGETLTQELKPEHHDEVWGINMVGNFLRCDAVFWMDDLKSQAALLPHLLVPTGAVKKVVHEFGEKIAEACGERVGRWMQGIMAAPDFIAGEVYNDIVEDMQSLINAQLLTKADLLHILAFNGAYQQDRAAAKPDENRSLKGLIEFLARHNTPVITPTRYEDIVPASCDYPLDEIAQLSYDIFGRPYLNNGVAMAIAYAIWKGVKTLKIYGCDFTYPNRNFAEGGRACVEAWATAAVMRDISVGLAPHTSLFDRVGEHAIYGYAEQPRLVMNDGTVFEYSAGAAAGRFGGEYLNKGIYAPEDSSGKAGANNVISFAAQADSASGHAARRHAEPGVGHAAYNAGAAAAGQPYPPHAQA